MVLHMLEVVNEHGVLAIGDYHPYNHSHVLSSPYPIIQPNHETHCNKEQATCNYKDLQDNID